MGLGERMARHNAMADSVRPVCLPKGKHLRFLRFLKIDLCCDRSRMNNCIELIRCTKGLIYDQLLFLIIFTSRYFFKLSKWFISDQNTH